MTQDPHALLTVAEMARADGLAIAGGMPGITLMENAGAGVARAICMRWTPRPTLVLCGPGNNGGDGFVVARLLSEAGWPVRLALLGERAALRGDAALAAARWSGPVESLAESHDGVELVVDALFGAGLSRPLEGDARAVLESLAHRRLAVVAVDVPSGVHGDSGRVLGTALPADLTVSFFRKKPGHVLLPGRALCGTLEIVDIGIPDSVLDTVRPAALENSPTHWREQWPRPALDGHKFARGHALISGGGKMTGAARLAARAALRIGAGLVTVACPLESFAIYAASLTAIMVEPVDGVAGFAALLADARRNAVLLGPGAGVSEELRARVLATLAGAGGREGGREGGRAAGRAVVLDADALTGFADAPAPLFAALTDRCLLTPHEGEFARLFPVEQNLPDKLTRARAAAGRSGAVVLLKGADTVIAAPDGRVVINTNAPPWLATAGAGDVLAGLALGLIAAGMPVFEAACAAVWFHGAAAAGFGPGLIAEDLPELMPRLMKSLCWSA
ncbi:MAG: NAD(P)H-hydrate dehydratase [Rhodospirillaceae bacterium]